LAKLVAFDADSYAHRLELEHFGISHLLIDVERNTDVFQSAARNILRCRIAVLVAELLEDLPTLIIAVTDFPVRDNIWPSPLFGWLITASMISAL
jgi:hypothetical protein